MLDIKNNFIDILVTLDRYRKNLSQSQKDDFYKQIRELRNSPAASVDPVGYNQLHWAVLCDQSLEEVNRLINEEKIDVNVGTRFSAPLVMFNMLPSYFAVKNGNKKLLKCLLNNGSNEEYTVKNHMPLRGPLSGNDYSHEGDKYSISKFALQNVNPTFKFFEKKLIADHHQKVSNNPNEYDSILPAYCASFFYYSNKEVLAAENAYTELLNQEQKTEQWRSKLNALKYDHPAVEQGDLGEIYEAGLKSRNI